MFFDQWTKIAPKHWARKKLKHVASLRSGESITADSISDQGEFPVYGGNGLRGYTGKYTHEGEFVLIGRQGALCGNVNYAKGRFWASEHAIVITRRGDDDMTWLGELLRYLDLNRLSQSAAQPGISAEEVSNVLLAVPPLAEQGAISAYVKRETARLDALVIAKQRLIDLLAEKRKAIITAGVTRGLDPKVNMRDSGVPWMGNIPAHWGIVQSRRLFRVRNEPARSSDRQLTASQKYGMLFQSDFVELEGRRVVELTKGAESLRHVEPNDFVISLRSFQGGLEWSKLAGSVTFHYVVLVPVKWVHPPYFAHLFKSLPFIEALRSTATLIRDGQDLRFSHFTLVDLPIVPIEEQRQIASHLDRETSKIDAVRAATERTIALLKERRSALIAAAVTGQLDLGEVA